MRQTPQEIMTLALRYYTDRVRREQWNKTSSDHEQIVALTAELQSFKGRDKTKKGKKKEKGGKHKKGDKKGDNKKKVPKWKVTPPTDGVTMKTVNDKTYNWCLNHKAWVAHTTANCKGIGTNTVKPSDNESKPTAQPTKPKVQNNKMQFRKALNAIIEASDDDDDDE
jgi:hypothetical protein